MKPLWIGLFIVSILALTGILTVEYSWRKAIHSQWTADHELAVNMIDFRDRMNAIEASNFKMKSLRVAITAALGLQPEAVPALRALLTAESIAQKLRLRTRLKLPLLPWRILPPDSIGEKPLEPTRPKMDQEKFYGSKRVQQRRSDVVVYKKQDKLWHARFTLGPSII